MDDIATKFKHVEGDVQRGDSESFRMRFCGLCRRKWKDIDLAAKASRPWSTVLHGDEGEREADWLAAVSPINENARRLR